MISIHSQLIYEINSNTKLIHLLRTNSFHEVIVIVDKGVAQISQYWTELRDVLDKTFNLYVIIAETDSEPTYAYLDEVVNVVRKRKVVDVIIGIGGGSTLDLTKAVAALRNNPGNSIEYRGFDKVMNPAVPTVCIPTTAGTGSEATLNAVFTDLNESKKLGINGKNMFATYSVLDARWTEGCPKSVALSSGLDALVHSLESFVTWKSTEVTRQFSKLAMSLIIENLPNVIKGPINLESHQKMLLGSYFAGIALFNSGSGISGAMSYPIGVLFKVPHGYAGGITLPSVIRFNIENGWLGYSELVQNEYVEIKDKKKLSVLFLEKIEELYRALDVPKNFDKWNLDGTQLEKLMSHFQSLEQAFNQNPIMFSANQDARYLIKKHLS